jgi:cytochrome c556
MIHPRRHYRCRPRAWLSVLVLVCSVHVAAMAQDQNSARAKEVIVARKTLMNAVEENANKIADMISGRKITLIEARAYADTISVLLMAFPHLFPPDTNQWREGELTDPATDTTASPEIWENFADFYQLARSAAQRADELRHATSEDEVKTLHRGLGNICDTCHSLYLKE